MTIPNLDKLTLESIPWQFCSDHLKGQIEELIKERDALKKQLGDSRFRAQKLAIDCTVLEDTLKKIVNLCEKK